MIMSDTRISMNSRSLLAMAMAASLALAACSGSSKSVAVKPQERATPGDTARGPSAAETLLAQLRQSYATTPMLSLNGDMKISGAGVTVWYDALVRGRDSLRINLVGPFGVPVGALSATPDQFLFFNAQEGVAM